MESLHSRMAEWWNGGMAEWLLKWRNGGMAGEMAGWQDGVIGIYWYRVCRPVSQRLVTSQASSVRRYNKIIREQFFIHHIEEHLNAVNNMTRYCGYPLPPWLRSMIIKLYKQMIEIRVHAMKHCRKILWPSNDFSLTIQMWYNRIHAYLPSTHTNESGENEQLREHSKICLLPAYSQPRQPETWWWTTSRTVWSLQGWGNQSCRNRQKV